MKENEFDYREQLAVIYNKLRETADLLYCLGFNIGLKGELKDFGEILEDGEEIPGDLNFLKSLDNESVAKIVEMIERIFAAQASLINVNNLNLEDLEEEVDLSEESDLDEDEPEISGDPIEEGEMDLLFNLHSVFLSVCQLAEQKLEYPPELFDELIDEMLENNVSLESEDVRMLLNTMNQVLEDKSGRCFWEEE